MVAVVNTSPSLHRVFNYNENKVKEGVATCIAAVNYPKDLQDLTLTNKINRLLNAVSLRKSVRRNAIHISLNFHPSESFSHEKLQAIADSYMDKIGFSNQPYLVYEHTDAGHPHIHIVSVKVDDQGNRMKTNNIGRNESTQARLQIEKDFGLIPAEGRNAEQVYELGAVKAKVVEYGKSATKQAIQNVLVKVLEEYNYTSLHELNAVLKLYNVAADRGKEEGIVFKNKGLYFRVLDNKTGNMLGVPIKASDFYFQPTIARLQEKFQTNKGRIDIYRKKKIRNAIDLVLIKPGKVDLQELVAELNKQGIATVLRQNKQSGPIYGLTFVDHTTKLVINGSDLGKLYSANAIQERCRPADNAMQANPPTQQTALPKGSTKKNTDHQDRKHINTTAADKKTPIDHDPADYSGNGSSGKSMLEILMEPEYDSEFIPGHLRLGRKKRKKKRIN